MLYLYNENMWNHLGPLQIHGIISIQLNLCQHCITKHWAVLSIYPLLKSASRSNISCKREDTQPCYMYFGNSLFAFRQKLGNNPRLKVLSSCVLLSLLCIRHLLSTHFHTIQLVPKHPRPDHLGIVYQIVPVTFYSISKCDVWGLIYIFIFEGIHFLIINDTKINTEVLYRYALCLFMSTQERSVAPTCALWDVAQLKAMISAMYCQIFLHLIQQLAGHVKGNQRNMERHLFSILKIPQQTNGHVRIHLILFINFWYNHKANCSRALYLENQYLKNLKLSLGPFYFGPITEQSALRHLFQKTPKAWF